jgi:hypothetical protein
MHHFVKLKWSLLIHYPVTNFSLNNDLNCNKCQEVKIYVKKFW